MKWDKRQAVDCNPKNFPSYQQQQFIRRKAARHRYHTKESQQVPRGADKTIRNDVENPLIKRLRDYRPKPSKERGGKIIYKFEI